MFSLHEIEAQITAFREAAEDLEERARTKPPLSQPVYRSHADGLRVAANSLERMVDQAIEREFRDFNERGVA